MEVDTETGATTMRKYVASTTSAPSSTRCIVSGQVHGGLVQGIAQALWEEAVYDESGTLVTGSFVDYTLPTAADTISFDIDHTTSPATYTTLGTKGVGEAGTIASTPGRGQRGRRRAAAVGRHRHPDAVHAGAGVEGDPARSRPVRRSSRSPTPQPHFGADDPEPGSRRRLAPKEAPSDPRRSSTTRPRRPSRRRSPLLAEAGDDAKVLAGGQSLLPVLRMRLNAPELVVDLGRIESLRGIRDDGDALVIGAMTTYQTLLDDACGRTSTCSADQGDRDDRRPADPAPGHGRRRARRTPTRPATSARRRWRSTPRS